MQQSVVSTLHPSRSRDALRKLRAAAEKELEVIPPGVVAVVKGDIEFDKKTPEVSQPAGDPNDTAGAATYSGQNSPHIGNGSGGPQ